jgi:hypothetical protein
MSLVPYGGGEYVGGGGAFGGDSPTININVNTQNLNIAAQNIEKFANVAQNQFNQINNTLQQAAKQGEQAAEAIGGKGINLGMLVSAQAIWSAIQGTIKIIVDLTKQLIRGTVEWHDSLVTAGAQFKGLAGSAEGASAVMQRVRDLSQSMNISLGQALQTTQLFLPVLAKSGRGIGELEHVVDIARRLSASVPDMGVMTGPRGAAIALAELQAGNYQSLLRRFNIGAQQLNETLAEVGGDPIEALDLYLNRLGYTTEVALASTKTMQTGWERVRDAVLDLADRALGPLLDKFVIPGLNKLADFAMALGAIADRAKDLFGQFGGAGGFMGAVHDFSESILNAPAKALAPILTSLIANFNNLDANTVTTGEIIKLVGENLVNYTVPAFSTLAYVILNANATFTKLAVIVAYFGVELLEFAAQIAQLTGNRNFAQIYQDAADRLRDIAVIWNDSIPVYEEAARAAALAGLSLQQAIEEARSGTLPQGGTDVNLPNVTTQENDLTELLDDWDEFNEQRAKIERDTDDKIIDARKDYQLRATRDTEEFTRKLAREEEDFNIKRARAAEKLARDVADVQGDLNRKIGDIRRDAEKDQLEAQQQVNRDLEKDHEDHLLTMRRMQEDHDEKISDAAARLDAVAIINENRKYAKDRRRAEEDFQLEQAQQREEFQIEMQQRQSDANERIALARDEARRHIEDLQRRYQLEDRMAREDQQRKLDRMRQDFQIEQAERQQQLQMRLTEIRTQGQKELAELQAALDKKLLAYRNEQNAELGVQNAAQNASLAALEAYYNQLVASTPTSANAGGTYGSTTGGRLGRRQFGGPALFTGLHALERGEHVLSRPTVRALESMMGGQLTQRNLLDAIAGGRNVTVNAPISVTGYNGDPSVLARKIRREIDSLVVKRLEGFAS